MLNASLAQASSYNLNLWSHAYEQELLKKIGQEIPLLASYPSLQYPNTGFENLPDRFSDEKVLLFGYGSLMNKASASRSLDAETLATMKPVIAFGVKRIFNYKASKTDHWGSPQHPLEKAMLNIIPMTTFRSVTNGVTIEVKRSDFERLVQRETGYDLMPILVADWEAVSQENPDVSMKIAYTFVVPSGIRNGITYVQTKYYPVRGYLHAAQEGANDYGDSFLDLWNHTTYLADGITTITNWDEEDFETLLDSKEP